VGVLFDHLGLEQKPGTDGNHEDQPGRAHVTPLPHAPYEEKHDGHDQSGAERAPALHPHQRHDQREQQRRRDYP